MIVMCQTAMPMDVVNDLDVGRCPTHLQPTLFA